MDTPAIPPAKFSIGEEVITLRGWHTTLHHIIESGEGVITHSKFVHMHSTWAYLIPTLNPTTYFAEAILRKKYKSGDDFETIINDLKQPIREGELA